jgi:Tfp pilus assembly protein PilW
MVTPVASGLTQTRAPVASGFSQTRKSGSGQTASVAGFSLVELLVATVVTIMIIGGATMLAGQMQMSYRLQLEGATAQQEARAAVEMIQRFLRGAGNNPYRIVTGPCPAASTPFLPVRLDPDGDGIDDDIRVQLDSNPVDSLIGGTAGACTQAWEDVTIAHDPAALTITVRDNNIGGAPTPRTDTVITQLRFIYRNSSRAITNVAASVAFIETQVTARTAIVQEGTANPLLQTVTSEVRLRVR